MRLITLQTFSCNFFTTTIVPGNVWTFQKNEIEDLEKELVETDEVPVIETKREETLWDQVYQCIKWSDFRNLNYLESEIKLKSETVKDHLIIGTTANGLCGERNYVITKYFCSRN